MQAQYQSHRRTLNSNKDDTTPQLYRARLVAVICCPLKQFNMLVGVDHKLSAVTAEL
jgi:hypothetical protein